MRFRIIKRKPLPGWAKIVIPIAAILTTLILAAIPILLAGGHLWKSYYYLFHGALGTRYNLLETFVKASPLLLTGLAVAFAFRAKFWNIGAEGQLLAGALTATVLGVHLGSIPPGIGPADCHHRRIFGRRTVGFDPGIAENKTESR